ncbi:MAG: DUF4179 domain-containing protein [Turicibacter sp.]|nr:DUF4179 domain-containing protein [Turicibacter sp.]
MNSKAYEEAVLKGITRAKTEINQQKKTMKLKPVMPMVASIEIVGIIGLSQPEIVKAVQEMTQSFNAFSAHLFGESTGRFQEVAKMIGMSQINQESTITLDEVVLDDNLLMMALTVESDFLSGYEKLNENDFFNLDYYLFVNGREILANSSKVRQIDETTGAIIIEASVADLHLQDKVNIDLRISHLIRGMESLKGKWNFSFKAFKLSGGERLNPDAKIEYAKTTISANQVVKSQLANTIYMSVEGESADDVFYELGDLVIKGSNEELYDVDDVQGSFDSEKKEATFKLRVNSNWSDLDWIEIYPRTTERYCYIVKDKIHYQIYQTPNTQVIDDQYQAITRKPTDQELASGFALDEVTYYLNLQKSSEFKILSDFIGDEIWVNSTEKVTIEAVELMNDEVKIIFKLPDTYWPHNLTSLILFDDQWHDYARRKGQSVMAIEDQSQRLYSVRFDQIDTSKAYTIAIPLMPELNDEELAWSLRIPLK